MKTLYLSIYLILIAAIAGAQTSCNPGFSWTQSSNNTIDFTLAGSGPIHASYFWHFGNGNTDHVANPTNFYSVPGTYWVCLTVYDNGHACGTYCDSITVTGGHHCRLYTSGTVHDASCSTCHDGSISLSVLNGTAPLTFSWSNGSHNHYLSNASSGHYSVCITDSIGCTVCDTFYVGNHQTAGPCHASFSLVIDSTPHHYWAHNSTTGVNPISYVWTWGDGTFDTIPHPGHGYDSAGFYTICAYIIDASGCTDSMCISHHLNSSLSSMVSVEVDDETATGIYNPATENFSIYPNPASSKLYIAGGNQVSRIIITNLLGEKTLQIAEDNITTIDISGLPNGIYLLELQSGTIKTWGRFVKE